jgi:hypothetical protein
VVVVVWASVGRLNDRAATAAAAMRCFFFMVRLLMQDDFVAPGGLQRPYQGIQMDESP